MERKFRKIDRKKGKKVNKKKKNAKWTNDEKWAKRNGKK